MPVNNREKALSKKPKKLSENINLQGVDAKERKYLEEKLFLNEFTIDQFRDMAFWTWADGRIFLVNEEACRSLGYTKQELLSMSIPDIDVNFTQDKLSEFIEDNKYTGHVLMESRFKTKDGRTFPVEISSNYFYLDDKEYMVSLCRDITKRKRAEEALRQSEKKYRSLVEQVNDWVWEIDANGIYTYAGPRVRGLLGYEPCEIVGMSPFDYMAPEESKRVRALFDPIFEAREEFSLLENTLVKKDGGMVSVETSGVPIFDDQGTFIGYRGIDRDITERKWVEEALRESEEKYRIVADNTYDWEFWLSPGGHVLYTSPSCERITGHSAGELTKNPGLLFEITHPEDKPVFLAHVHAQQPSSHGELEFRIVARSGEVRWIHHICHPIHDRDGRFLGIRGSNRDITTRKWAEEALRESEEKLRSFFDLPLIGMALTTSEKRWVYANDRICEILGFSREELSRLTWEEITHLDDLDNDLEYFNRLLSGDIDSYTIEKRFMRKDGSIVYTQISIGCVRNPDNSVRYIAGLMQDITERKRAENALRDAKDQVELYVDLMGHDINNMNQVSMGFLELAHNIIEMEGKLGEDNIVLLDKAMDSLKNSSQLIDNVRKLRREKMGLYEPEVLDVGSVIEGAVKQFHGIPGRDVRITCKPFEDCLVRANSLLKDVFVNLVGNAVKHSRGSLSVNIGVSRVVDNGKTYCRIDVEDDGPGIPDVLKNTLFDRLSLTTTRARGKGFGLCLIKMLVDDYQGKFWVEDHVPGDYTKGARFVVMLPAVGK
jgi:PAS domain S-box-containing protein